MTDGTLIWQIGSRAGRSDVFIDDYLAANLLKDVVWNAGAPAPEQKFPLFHPSESDPEGG